MKNLILVLFCIILVSCTKEDTPSCINKKMEEVSCLKKVYEYDYKGMKIYYFEVNGCPDFPANWFDENCNIICSSGGFDGGDDCSDFYQNATNQKLIWEK